MQITNRLKPILLSIKEWLSKLSFKTGIYTLLACVLLYAASFAQMLLSISPWAKSALWVILFGLAKTAQYSAIVILGKAGISRLRRFRKFG